MVVVGAAFVALRLVEHRGVLGWIAFRITSIGFWNLVGVRPKMDEMSRDSQECRPDLPHGCCNLRLRLRQNLVRQLKVAECIGAS